MQASCRLRKAGLTDDLEGHRFFLDDILDRVQSLAQGVIYTFLLPDALLQRLVEDEVSIRARIELVLDRLGLDIAFIVVHQDDLALLDVEQPLRRDAPC